MNRRLVSLAGLVLALLAPLASWTAADTSDVAGGGREQLSLDRGWLFHLGDLPFPFVTGHDNTYRSTKAGNAPGAAGPEFDDSLWRGLDVPHDWVIEGPVDPGANVSQGYRRRGVAWYRRHFQLSDADRSRHLELQFDGVATHCTVWVNGILAHRNWCGYTSFTIDFTAFARFGDEENTIAVRVDAEPMEGWWYEGGGIYRHTWLTKRAPVHVATDGVYAQPVRGADGGWRLPVEATIANVSAGAAAFALEVALVDGHGNVAVRGRAEASVAPLGETVVKLTLPVTAPRLWSVDDPVLYSVRTVVLQEEVPVDAVTTTCGFRTIRFDADEGFFLNDEPLKLKGVCNHQDHAGVGVAVPDALWEFRLRRLKEMGVNAYRCAHNPPAAEFLDACDRLGVLVMDENRNFNSTPEYLRQLEWLVRRDRNHPSVILWSVFNEEPMQATRTGYEMVRRMAAVVKQLDATRPVTAAMSAGFFTPLNVSAAVDVMGFNYNQGDYDRFHAEHPALPITSSEDTSAYMTRGAYESDPAAQVIDSYDTQAASWGATHRAAWQAVASRPFVAGMFVWTGFDYHGEPTPYDWPSTSSFFGCLDLCGFPKLAFYLHQAQWIDDRPVLHLLPHWNWAGREGQPIKVVALTNAATVTLTLDGRSLGERTVDRHEMVSWEIPYTPGRLEAVASTAGREVARAVVETTGAPVTLRLVPDRASLAGDGEDAMPVTVEALDAAGRPVPTADAVVDFEISGPAEIIGLGNGDPNSHEPEKGRRRRLFNGLAQVIVQHRGGGPGVVGLRAHSASLRSAELALPVTAAPARPAVPARPRTFSLRQWRHSPATPARPDPEAGPADNDMNTWPAVAPGDPLQLPDGYWMVLRTRFFAPAAVRAHGGQIQFAALEGRAEVWVDGRFAGSKDSVGRAPLAAPLPAGEGEHTVAILFEGGPAEVVGLAGPVTVTR